MLLEGRLIKEYVFEMLVEAGIFDNYGQDDGWGDTTEALIPYYLSDEEKIKLMDRYDKMGMPYVVQSDPMDQPDQGDVMSPPRSRRQIVKDVLGTADRLEQEHEKKSIERQIQRAKRHHPDSASEKTMPMSRIGNMAQSDSTFPTGVISDYEEYSNPRGQDAQLSRMGDVTDAGVDTDSADLTFDFDKFNAEEDLSMPYMDKNSNLDGENLRESRGSLIRKKYFGRY